jgi:hypothetical protein
MKHLIFFLYLLSWITAYGQVTEDFNDGNFTTNPAWSGSNGTADFVVIDNKLRSNSTVANTGFFLSTANTLARSAQWELWVNLQFSTSSANYTDIYIISDKEDLKAASINGYFIRIGNTEDEISLYKRSGAASTSTRIIDGINGSVGSSNNTIKIRVRRDMSGTFTLEREIVAMGSSYFTEGSTTDLTHLNSSHFGIFIQQSTASFSLKHFFDNIKIEPLVIDSIPPSLLSVSTIDSTKLEILFSEAMDSLSVKTVGNFSINLNTTVAGIVTTSDPARFIVKLTSALNNGSYTLVAVNVQDKNGNRTMGNSLQFTYAKPYLVQPGDIVINEIFPDPSPQIGLPSGEFVELRNNTGQRISLKNWKLSDPGTQATLSDMTIDPGSFIILCARSDTTDFKSYGKTMGISPWPSLNNASDLLKLTNQLNTLIDSVHYKDTWYRDAVKKTGGWTLERRDPSSKCEGFFNWFPAVDSAGGTPGRENSLYTAETDLQRFDADSLQQLSDTTLRVFFNKPLAQTLLYQNFTLSPEAGSIQKIIIDDELKQVTLSYGLRFTAGTNYQLHISNVRDCSGNVISLNQEKLNFRTSSPPIAVPAKPDTAMVYITEIFADPSPEVQLPLAEFVEIYNPSKDTIDLDKWILTDGITKAVFPGRKILPQEYIILCPAADTSSYRTYGKTIGLNPWPSLNNNSDQISLKSHRNRSVDTVAYMDTWYRDPLKKSGGWSLEKVDMVSACAQSLNWTASTDTAGGTPGNRNSVSLHRPVLKADSVRIHSDTTLAIFFSKPVNEGELLVSNFTLFPGNNVVKTISSNRNPELILTWQNPLQAGVNYELTIANVRGCSGNTLLSGQSLKFKTATVPDVKKDTGKVIITEVFADPSPEVGLPLAEFVEIYNPGKDTIDLTKWTLSDAATKAILVNKTIGPGEYLILCPLADTISFNAYGKVIGLSPWPALGNNNDQIKLKNSRGRLVDSVSYTDKWYKNLTKRNGGWSLERISLQNNPCDGFYNWNSSEDLSGGTPGKVNSRNNALMPRLLRIDSLKFTLDSSIVVSLNTIPDTSYLKPAFFSIGEGIGKARKLTISDDYLKISLQFASKFNEGISYKLLADSLLDCTGKKSTLADSQVSFMIPVVPELDYPIVINEIFADPSPSVGLPEIEFVELYNPTERIVSLKGMIYADELTEYRFRYGQIAPHSYLILCAEKDTLNFIKLGKVHGLSVWPTLNNDSDVLMLKNNKGRELQRVSYSNSWYKDIEKKSGGYSLEMINPVSFCGGRQNWGASQNPSGGTPGKTNSISSRSTPQPLKLQLAELTDSLHLLLTFNHSIDSLSTIEPTNYQINNGVGEPTTASLLKPDYNTIQLKLRVPPLRGHRYTIEVQGLRDCSGSVISQDAGRAEFLLPKAILKGDILISEILFNPRPGGVDFVEIYNNAEHELDLRELSVGTVVKDSIGSVKKLRVTQTLIASRQYFAVTTDPVSLSQEYSIEKPDAILKVASLPAFNDNAGSVILLTSNTIIDKLTYTEKMHSQLLKSFQGVSLERSRLDVETNAPGNFRSATAASGFATPGYKNSQYSPTIVANERFSLTSRTFSPDNDGFEDYLELNYKMERPGMIANVKVFNDHGNLVRSLLKNFTMNIQGTFVWDGIDDRNTLSGTGIYIIYAEIFDENGASTRFRKSFALAPKL